MPALLLKILAAALELAKRLIPARSAPETTKPGLSYSAVEHQREQAARAVKRR